MHTSTGVNQQMYYIIKFYSVENYELFLGAFISLQKPKNQTDSKNQTLEEH